MPPTDDRIGIAAGYRRFAEVEAVAVSPRYAELAAAVAADDAVLDFLVPMPAGKPQPNLLFAAVQHLRGTPTGADDVHRAVLEDGDRLRATMLTRATQTNEAARCAALLPVLTRLDGPLALIGVGASAGLCLYPDRYSYDYDGVPGGPRSPVHLSCATTGPGWTPPPRSPPASPPGCSAATCSTGCRRRSTAHRRARPPSSSTPPCCRTWTPCCPDPEEARGRFVLAVDGRPVAWTAPHGGRIDWFAGTMPR